MHDDPREIANYLIQEHGLDGALHAAIAGAVDAQHHGDNYTLSVWREIKAVVRQRLAERAANDQDGNTPLAPGEAGGPRVLRR